MCRYRTKTLAMRLILFVLPCILFSPGLTGQGKIYLIPHAGFYTGSYRGEDSVNSKQHLIKSVPFLGKDFIVGVRVAYYGERWGVSAGIEQGNYSTGFRHRESRQDPYRVNSFESSSERCIVLFAEARNEMLPWNLKKPRWLFHSSAAEKPNLLAGTVAPVAGIEYRYLSHTFINDFPEASEITTSQGSVPGTFWYHAEHKKQISLRAGVDITFYDNEKRKFILSFLYSVAFSSPGYFRYHFSPPGGSGFNFQNSTRGNGFSIKAAFPFKIAGIHPSKEQQQTQ